MRSICHYIFHSVSETGPASIDIGSLYEPRAITFSFHTPAWYAVGIFLFLTLSLLTYRWVKIYRNNAYRRKAILEIDKMESQNSCTIKELMAQLKIVAMTSFGRKTVAPLYGRAWLEFLDSKAKETKFKDYSDVILDALYKEKSGDSKQVTNVMRLSKKWIKTHA